MKLNEKQVKSLERIIDYLYDEERRGYLDAVEDEGPDSDYVKNHVFCDVNELARIIRDA